MKYFSLFSGIGGFELGITQAYEENSRLVNQGGQVDSLPGRQETFDGARVDNTHADRPSDESNKSMPVCVGFSEIDKYATVIYQKHFPDHKNYGDITKINEKELPDFDLLCGGFPCQSFSIAGKRGGFSDTRGTLFFEIERILNEKKPRLLLLENVKGLLSHENGTTFKVIISTLDELGYDLQWQVLNSKDFGVPQNRERVFIVGHLRGTRRPKVFSIRLNGGENNRERKPVFSTLRATYPGNWNGDYVDTDTKYGQKEIHQLNQPRHSNDRIYGTDGISPTLNTMQGGNRQPFIPENAKIRRLTPIECERLQGFPDGWTSGVSDSQRYKTLGNAVTVNVIKEIMKAIKSTYD